MKNYCYCKKIKNVIIRDQICFARWHTGTTFEYTLQDIQEDIMWKIWKKNLPIEYKENLL